MTATLARLDRENSAMRNDGATSVAGQYNGDGFEMPSRGRMTSGKGGVQPWVALVAFVFGASLGVLILAAAGTAAAVLLGCWRAMQPESSFTNWDT